MGKKKIMFKYLFFIFVVCSVINSYAQKMLTTELIWSYEYPTETLIFKDKSQINEWGIKQLPFSSVSNREFSSHGININVVLISGCSGLPCWYIFIFTEKEGSWYLTAKTSARLEEQLMLKTDNKSEKLIFQTNSSKIGELLFETLVLKYNKIE
jgi:hypothetical protein